MINNRKIIGLNRIGQLNIESKYFPIDLHKFVSKKIVIKNKLSISYRWGKSMHYPESPKVTEKPRPRFDSSDHDVQWVEISGCQYAVEEDDLKCWLELGLELASTSYPSILQEESHKIDQIDK